MNIVCHIYPNRTTRSGANMLYWVRATKDDGTYSEDVPVTVVDVTASELTMQAAIRTAVASRMADVLGAIVLATDIRFI